MTQRARSTDDKLARKEKILESAKKLFSRHGYQGTTIEMITEDSGLSPAAFYLYFKNKLDIYRELTAAGIDILQEILVKAISVPSISPAGKIRAIAHGYLSFFCQHREYYDITAILHLGQKEFFANLDMVPQLEQRATDLLNLIHITIREGIKSGDFRQADAWKSSVALWGMIDGVLMLEVKESTGFVHTTLEQLIDTCISIVLEGLSSHNKAEGTISSGGSGKQRPTHNKASKP